MLKAAHTTTMALHRTPTAEIEAWAGAITAALLDQAAWYRPALTRQEIGTLTGLSGDEVARGCWHGRLHGLLRLAAATGEVRYTLTPLGAALARRMRASQPDGAPDDPA